MANTLLQIKNMLVLMYLGIRYILNTISNSPLQTFSELAITGGKTETNVLLLFPLEMNVKKAQLSPYIGGVPFSLIIHFYRYR